VIAGGLKGRCGVYCLFDPRCGTPRYVGKAKCLATRSAAYLRYPFTGATPVVETFLFYLRDQGLSVIFTPVESRPWDLSRTADNRVWMDQVERSLIASLEPTGTLLNTQFTKRKREWGQRIITAVPAARKAWGDALVVQPAP
jgi:hypothetical protein